MITLKNSQKKIPFNTEHFINDAQQILILLGYPDFDLGIWLTTNKTIRLYNKTYRHKDKATDVLSFPYHTELKAGQRINIATDEDRNLGDIIISLEYVVKAAQELNVTFESRMRVLLVHGICHLLGYDHIEDKDFAVMRRKESFLLKHLSQTT
jgi:probable rRNA maturation factor